MAEKSPEAFRTISEVAEEVRVPAHVLRFWESRFAQIRPVKRAGGRRYYRPEDVELIAGIKRLLHDHGMTIRGVQKLLKDHGTAHVAGLAIAGPAQPGAPGQAPFAPPPALVPGTWPAGQVADPDAPREIFQAEPLPRPMVRAVGKPAPAAPRLNGAHHADAAARTTDPLPADPPPAAMARQIPAEADPPALSRPEPAPSARLRLSLSPDPAGEEGPALTPAMVLPHLLALSGGGVVEGAERLRPLVARLIALRDRLAADLPVHQTH